MTVHADTGIVYTTAAERAVGFIFCDSIYMTGSLLMASLQRIRASEHLADLARAIGRDADADHYTAQADLGRAHVYRELSQVDGDWLRASTGTSQQRDVWGTLVALMMDVIPTEHRDTTVQRSFRP